ncbi:MAG: aspartate kinase [Bacteroidales bacterium]|nr:aspartate kinase [Bacteroidales bacterium]
MIVYKFGGASVKNAEGIRNLASIVSGTNGDLVVVVSAFGKTTNALEQVLRAWFAGNNEYADLLARVREYHYSIVSELFGDTSAGIGRTIEGSFDELSEYMKSGRKSDYDLEYDQLVSRGEIWSTLIVEAYLKKCGLDTEWIDIRQGLITDERYRDANVLWDESSWRVHSMLDFSRRRIYVTQGFIGGTLSGKTTTLGREGSDYTAALIAGMLNAEYVVVWKDVPGIMNADPQWLSNCERLDEISYREAVEMTFSGAKVIHPKTIKPLHNKGIPLHVKSFLTPAEEGTIIKADAKLKKVLPVYVRKENQMLISILPKDFSFVMGENLGNVFRIFSEKGIKVNLVEASAVSIDICVDDERDRIEKLREDLKEEYSIIYNENVEMLSIRHYTEEAIDMITRGREILLEQRTRSSVRFVVRKV